MQNKTIHYLFFTNYFVGLLAIFLNIESTIQLGLSFNNYLYFVLLFSLPTIYYTYAYTRTNEDNTISNTRIQWYLNHSKFINYSQSILSSISAIILVYFFIHYYQNIQLLSIWYWFSIFLFLSAAISYYGLHASSFFTFNLRNTGWLKSFIIGFVWACCASLAPIIMLKIETGIINIDITLWIWLFIKNWMFCTVNAIMFDVKDYPSDANLHLRTFIVRFGLRKTIYYILIPLSTVGLLALCVFAYFNHFRFMQLFFNVLPFLLTIYLAFKLLKRKSNLFYLIAIDGLILFKALCGIAGAYFSIK